MISSPTVAVVRRRPEVLADALDEVRPAGAARVHRALGVGADDPDPPPLSLLEVPPGAADRPAGTDAGDEVGDPALGRTRSPARSSRSGSRAHRVGVLVRLPGARRSRAPAGPTPSSTSGVLRVDRGRADDDLGAVRPQHVLLVLAHLVGADEHEAVPALLGHQRQPDAGVAGGRLDDRAAGLAARRTPRPPRSSGARCGPSPTRRVEVLHLGEHRAGDAAA